MFEVSGGAIEIFQAHFVSIHSSTSCFWILEAGYWGN